MERCAGKRGRTRHPTEAAFLCCGKAQAELEIRDLTVPVFPPVMSSDGEQEPQTQGREGAIEGQRSPNSFQAYKGKNGIVKCTPLFICAPLLVNSSGLQIPIAPIWARAMFGDPEAEQP